MTTSPCHNATMTEKKGVLVCDVCGHELAVQAPTPSSDTVSPTLDPAEPAAPTPSKSETRRRAASKKAK